MEWLTYLVFGAGVVTGALGHIWLQAQNARHAVKQSVEAAKEKRKAAAFKTAAKRRQKAIDDSIKQQAKHDDGIKVGTPNGAVDGSMYGRKGEAPWQG